METFGGRDRVFTPDEIMGYELPMTLDTAHLHDDERMLYNKRVPAVSSLHMGYSTADWDALNAASLSGQ